MKPRNKTNMIIGVFVLGVAFGAYEFYDFWTTDFPRFRQEEANQEQVVVSLQAELTKLKSFAKNIQNIKQEFRELNLQLEAALEHMPRTFNLASLLRKLTMLAQNSGIEISVFRPRRELAQVSPENPNPAANATEKQSSLFYESILVEFNLQGPFTQTMVFFDQLARLKRIVNIDSVRMSVKKEEGAKISQTVSNTEVLVRTYRFTE